MSDIKSMIKDLETIIEHGAADIHKAAKKEEHTPQELETVKNIAKLAYYKQILSAMEEAEEDEGYSERGYSQRGGNGYSQRRGYSRTYPMYYGNAYEDGMSYARGGRRRDSMGRYSSNSYRGYSMDDSRDMMMSKLEEAMSQATTERERQAIEQCMERMSM